ncbi:MAG: tetratricopeptide repeat protein [Pyrinomonadaceae bacterium]
MANWPLLLSRILYSPVRGMREVRDRGSLAPIIVSAYLSQIAYVVVTQWLSGNAMSFTRGPMVITGMLFHAAGSLLPVAVVLVPVLALMANLLERRGSFGVVIRQEYVSLASTVFAGFMAANFLAVLMAALLHFSGLQAMYVANTIQEIPRTLQIWRSFGASEEFLTQLNQFYTPVAIAGFLFLFIKLTLFIIGTVLAVHTVFRFSVLRSLGVVLLSFIGSFPLWGFLYPVFHTILGSPFLLLMLFFLLRGYLGEVTRTHKARASFKQNLEAATLNPADASAHYNLGLIHQQRGELDLARERFKRAVDIDADEVDAHYQLGRIARAQSRWADAIGHFEQVVARDRTHTQHEIWREIGATYIAAGQFADARDAMERFLDHRQMDPEGLYMMGRAHAGLGHSREATSSMQACIEAVKTAPAYKYRTEKRWLNEAQQFLKVSRQEAVGK